MKNTIINFIDFFHPPFRKFIPLKTFRYAACGGTNALLNLVIFHIGDKMIFVKPFVDVLGFKITQYIAAYFLALLFSFPIGFCLNRYVVFQESNLQSRIQLARYASITITSIFLDYLMLHLLVGYFEFNATLSQAFIIVVLSLFSYFSQTYFTFKTVK